MPSHRILAATSASIALLVLGGLMLLGRYEVRPIEEDAIVRLDRWTGEIAYCRRWANDAPICITAPEMHHDGKTPLNAEATTH